LRYKSVQTSNGQRSNQKYKKHGKASTLALPK